jgi:hypothetical protein
LHAKASWEPKLIDNLTSLHTHEEQLRARSLTVIEADAGLSDHWKLVAEAMNAIYAFSHDHPHESENELTLQYLGIRLFNVAGASIKLALSGYYQNAFGQLRDLIETSFLVDYLSTHPEKIDEWKRADKKKRIAHFGAGVIRNALDKRDGYTSGERKRIYDLISELASHAQGHGAGRTVLRRQETCVVAGRDGAAPKSRGLDTLATTQRERHQAPDDPRALSRGRQQMVVEVPRHEAPGGALGSDALRATWPCGP